MSYRFSQGYRLVVPFIDTLKCGVKDVWIGRPVGEVWQLVMKRLLQIL